jgi:hypothetical protein
LALLIPVGLSAYLWLGSPLFLGGPLGHDTLWQAAGLIARDDRVRDSLMRRLLDSDGRVVLAWLNLVPVLAPADAPAQRGIIWLAGPLQLVGAFALINLIALLVSSMFLTVLGGAVGGEGFSLGGWLRRSADVARTLALAILAALGVGLLLGLPFLAISAIVIAAVPASALAVSLAWYIVCFWAYVYAGFAPEAILISRSGPLRALYQSVNIVRRNLMGTLGLLVVSFLIISGLGVIWHQLTQSPLGAAAAILGSAYIGSGLSAARIEFYRDRADRWNVERLERRT